MKSCLELGAVKGESERSIPAQSMVMAQMQRRVKDMKPSIISDY